MIAVANKRLEKGTSTLAKDWGDLDDVMTDSKSSLNDISEVMPTINEGL